MGHFIYTIDDDNVLLALASAYRYEMCIAPTVVAAPLCAS